MPDDLENRHLAWFTLGLDIEALAAAAGALLIGILLGLLWSPLFWLGFIGMVVCLLAGRWSSRTAPDMPTAIVSPCDGRVVSISRADPPSELRIGQEDMMRVRIASAPTSTNKLYAPIASSVESVVLETGEQTAFFAMRPHEEGLSQAYVSFDSQGQEVGVHLSQGGFGPRLDLDVEDGDIVRLGRRFGTRRLGGWCDLYIPRKAGMLVWQGQTLTGGETVIARLKSEDDPVLFDEEVDATIAQRESYIEDTDYKPEALEDVAKDSDADAGEDPTDVFAKLREEVRKEAGEEDKS